MARHTLLCAALLGLLPALVVETDAATPRLKVSDNKRFLVTAEGQPFFYLGDTAWELFHRRNREEADRYLEDRAKKGFTVIHELNGLNDPNPYGHKPLVNNDPTKPDVKDGPRNDYWDHVDYIVDKANREGLYIGFLPTAVNLRVLRRENLRAHAPLLVPHGQDRRAATAKRPEHARA
jgi:hypothetical protein